MRHLVAKDVDDDRSRQTYERDEPKDDTEREEPKFRAGPQALINRRSGESGEKCLGQDRAPWQQKNRNDVFDPTRRDGQRHRGIRRPPRRRHDIAHDLYSRWFATITWRRRPARRHEIILSRRMQSRHFKYF